MKEIRPPAECLDPRLWATAQELAEQHPFEQGRCPSCATPWPCRKAEAAEEAKRRAMPPPPPPPPPVAEYQAPTLPVLPVLPDHPDPVGARFPRESRVGRRRRSG